MPDEAEPVWNGWTGAVPPDHSDAVQEYSRTSGPDTIQVMSGSDARLLAVSSRQPITPRGAMIGVVGMRAGALIYVAAFPARALGSVDLIWRGMRYDTCVMQSLPTGGRCFHRSPAIRFL